jgi:hypothetical protein
MRFVIFISIVQSILFLGHWFLYRTVVRFFGVANPTKLFALRTALALLSVSLVTTSFLARRYSNLLVRDLYTVAASWLGIFYLFILASILCWIFYGLGKLFHLPLNGKILIGVLMNIALVASVYGLINSGMIRITRINVPLPNCPGPWKGKTAVWVSDTHLGPIRNYGFAQDVAAKVKSLNPDIVFIGGDLYDVEAVDLGRMIEPFSRISPALGTYFVTGNHEEFGDNTPFHLQVARERGISVQLSGDTHQGQVFLFRFITAKVYQGYDYGLKRFGNLLVYTSSGVGTWGPPMRIDTKPEIVVITFR